MTQDILILKNIKHTYIRDIYFKVWQPYQEQTLKMRVFERKQN